MRNIRSVSRSGWVCFDCLLHNERNICWTKVGSLLDNGWELVPGIQKPSISQVSYSCFLTELEVQGSLHGDSREGCGSHYASYCFLLRLSNFVRSGLCCHRPPWLLLWKHLSNLTPQSVPLCLDGNPHRRPHSHLLAWHSEGLLVWKVCKNIW